MKAAPHQTIEVGRFDFRIAERRNRVPTLIVGHDQQDIRPRRRSGTSAVRDCQQRQERLLLSNDQAIGYLKLDMANGRAILVGETSGNRPGGREESPVRVGYIGGRDNWVSGW
jgi:hypothetical protein